MNYILITLCRNEEENLPRLAKSILNQSIRPLLWVIVDDNSIDSTPSFIDGLESSHSWIYGLFLKESKEYMGFHYSEIFNEAYSYATELSEKQNIDYDFIALSDADNILEKEYFEKIILEFSKNEKLGIASGISVILDVKSTLETLGIRDVMDDKLWSMAKKNDFGCQKSRENVPMGSARIWRKKCFEDTNGYLLTYSPDCVSNIKAKMKGWETKRFPCALALDRKELVVENVWKSYSKRGKSDYFIWYPLPLILCKSLVWSTKKPYLSGLAYLYGYLKPYLSRKTKLDDVDVKEYNQSLRYSEIKQYYSDKLL